MSKKDKIDLLLIIIIMLAYGYYNYSHGYDEAIRDMSVAVKEGLFEIRGDSLHVEIIIK